MPRLTSRCLLLAALLWLPLSAQALFGAAYTWNVPTGSWTTAGSWTPGGGPPTTSDTGTISTGTATANATLAGNPDITVQTNGILFLNAFGSVLTGGGTVTATSGGRVDWQGTSASTSTILLGNGAKLGKPQNNVLATSNNPLSIAAGATVTAGNMNSTVTYTSLGLRLQGPLSSGDTASTLTVQPAVAGQWGSLILAPTTANTGFIGNVNIQQGPGATTGTLVLSGTGALSNVNNITIGSGGMLRFANATNPLPSAKVINVASGAIIDIEGTTSSYSVTPPTINLATGAILGHESAGTQNQLAISRENIVFGTAIGSTVTTGTINATVTRTNLGLELRGALSTFDSTSTLVVKPAVGLPGALVINPAAANTGFTGNVTIQPNGATTGTLVLSGTGALSNVGTININSGGILRFATATDPLASGKAISVPTGARVEWEGTPTFSVTPPTITFQNGSTFGREEAQNAHGISRDNILIAAGAIVTASRINSTVSRSTLGLELRGALSSGDASSNLVINPTTAGFVGGLMLNPTTPNTGFIGNVDVQAGPGVATPGTLVLSGNGALSNVNSLTIGSGAILKFRAATNPLPSGFNVNIPNGGRMEWEGTPGTYTVTPPTITFQNGSEFGRHEDSNQIGISRDNLVIAAGATVTARRISGTIPRTDLGIQLEGSLNGSANSTLVVNGEASGAAPYTLAFFGTVALNPTTANPYLGNVVVKGVSTNGGYLVLQGTGPLANAALLDTQQFGTTTVIAAGAANGIDEIRTRTGGLLRFRGSGVGGSSLSNTVLTGTGIIRSELIEAGSQNVNVDQALRPLNLNQVTVSPGLSAGTLTFQTTNLTMGVSSALNIELGTLSDLLVVNGNLILTSGSTLNLTGLAGLGIGTYTIATTTGTVTGTFGSITSMFVDPFTYESIFYGSNFISVTISAIPEPGTGLLLGLGFLGCTMVRRRNRQVQG